MNIENVIFVCLYCIITVCYSRECSWRAQLGWCVTGRKQETVRFAKGKPMSRSVSNSTVCDYRYASPLSSAIFSVGCHSAHALVWLTRTEWALLRVWLSRYSEWLRSDLPSFAFLFSLSLSSFILFSLCLLSSFPCLIFPYVVVLCRPANFLSCFSASLFITSCCHPWKMIFLFIILAIISVIYQAFLLVDARVTSPGTKATVHLIWNLAPPVQHLSVAVQCTS